MNSTKWIASLMTTVFAATNVMAAQAPAGNTARLPSKYSSAWKVELLRSNEINRLNPTRKIEYFRSLQNLVETIELEQAKPSNQNNAFLEMVMPFAEAATKEGSLCMIGGYISRLYKKPSGGLSCAAPDPKGPYLFDGGEKKEFSCGTSSKGEPMAYCNSAVYLYADNGSRFCQPIKNLSSNCKRAFESRYSKKSDPKYPERLLADYNKLSEVVNPESRDKFYDGLEKTLNYIIRNNEFSKGTAEVVLKQLNTIKAAKGLAAKQEPAKPEGTAGAQGTTTAATGATGTTTGAATSATTPQRPGGPTNTGANGTAGTAGVESEDNEDSPTETKPEIPAAPAVEGGGASSASDKILGDELSCVAEALTEKGYKPSSKYLALLATGLQAYSGRIYRKDDTKLLQTKVISMVQAYGFCDADSYPSDDKDTAQYRRWITADRGQVDMRGLEYLAKTSDTTGEAANRKLFDIFGIRGKAPLLGINRRADDKSLSTVSEGIEALIGKQADWDKQTPGQRQKGFTNWKAYADRDKPNAKPTDFEKCQANAKERMQKDPAFRLSLFDAEHNSAAEKYEAIRKERKEISDKNLEICEAMAGKCGVEVKSACSSNGLPAKPKEESAPAAPANGAPAAAPAADKPVVR